MKVNDRDLKLVKKVLKNLDPKNENGNEKEAMKNKNKTVLDDLNELSELMGIKDNPHKLIEEDFHRGSEVYSETELAVQEWGIKNNLRLFGIHVNEWGCPEKESKIKPEDKEAYENRPAKDGSIIIMRPMAKAFFTDTGFKNMIIIFFDIKKTGEKVTVSKSKAIRKGIKWPIKFARTNWESENVEPVIPLYWVLVDRGIILPFKSQLKKKEWAALPFEDMSGIKSTEI
jgi:hypothetical protein